MRVGGSSSDWPLPNADLEGTRDAPGSSIDSGNVGNLTARWRFRLPGKPTVTGSFASTPVVQGGTVYVQDLNSNVYALDLGSGAPRWVHRLDAPNEGPNGLAVDSRDGVRGDRRGGVRAVDRHREGALAPAPDERAASSSSTSRRSRGRASSSSAPSATRRSAAARSTRSTPPPARSSGSSTRSRSRGRTRSQSGGGGIWYPVSIDGDGRLYAGIANPTPWGGSPEFPNGSAFPGPVLYTDSLVVLDAKTGRLLWYDQVTPHDVRDYDFQATPILAGGARDRRWQGRPGDRLGPRGAHPQLDGDGRAAPERRRAAAAPSRDGLPRAARRASRRRWRTPTAGSSSPWSTSAAGAARSRARSYTDVDPSQGRGRLVALDAETGRTLWERRLPSPAFGCATVSDDVVFTSTYDGTLYAFATDDGRELWRSRMRAKVNACPAVAGDLVLFGAGVPRPGGGSPELVAYGPA